MIHGVFVSAEVLNSVLCIDAIRIALRKPREAFTCVTFPVRAQLRCGISRRASISCLKFWNQSSPGFQLPPTSTDFLTETAEDSVCFCRKSGAVQVRACPRSVTRSESRLISVLGRSPFGFSGDFETVTTFFFNG